MRYALWFLIKLSVLIFALIWVSAQTGGAQFTWAYDGDEYALNLTLGIFGCFALVGLALVLAVHKGLLSLKFGFKTFSLRRVIKKQGKAQKYVVQSLSAIAAGDIEQAEKFTAKARKNQNADFGLTDFLDGITSRMKGDTNKAKKHFTALSRAEHSASLGLRGLMQIGLDEGQFQRTTQLAERAYKMHPKQRWIIKTLYNLYLQNHEWEKAEDILPKMVKFGGYSKDKGLSDHIAILIARSEQRKDKGEFEEAYALKIRANKLDKTSLPAALALLPIYLKTNEKRKAVKIIEQVWPAHQHPELLKIWGQLMPARYKKDTAKYMSWYERLLALKPDSDEGQLAAAEAAMHEHMYGQARAYLKQAEKLRESKKLFRLYAALEEAQNNDKEKAATWLNRAVDALDNQAWVCMDTGLTYNEWSLFAKPHNSFNSIVWDYPENCKAALARGQMPSFSPVLLDTEQKAA